jgi:heme exporter protein D
MKFLTRSGFWTWLSVAFALASLSVTLEESPRLKGGLVIAWSAVTVVSLILGLRELRKAKAELKAAEADTARVRARIREAMQKSLEFRRN